MSQNEPQIFDMEEDGKVPDGIDYGESWRSKRIYRCEICGTETNRWVFGGYPSRGPRLLCPARDTSEHDELEELHERRLEIEERVGRYEKFSEKMGTDSDVVSHLWDELAVIEDCMSRIRDDLQDGYEDIRGIDGSSEVVTFNSVGT